MIRYLLLLACAAAPSFAEEAAAPPAPPRPVLSELVTEGAIRQRVFAGIIEAEVTSTKVSSAIISLTVVEKSPSALVTRPMDSPT